MFFPVKGFLYGIFILSDAQFIILTPYTRAPEDIGWIFKTKLSRIPWIMTKGGPITATEILPVLIYRTAFGTLKVGQGAAIAVITALILFLWVIFYIKLISHEK